jgi:hypothetical protein
MNFDRNSYILKHDQQDATFYNTLYYCQRCTCFERFFRSSSGAQSCTCRIRYLSDLFAVTASVDELRLLCVYECAHTQTSPMYRFELLMMSGKTSRNLKNVDNNTEYYTTLHLVGHA